MAKADGGRVVTTILLDAKSWRLLSELARLRAERIGGRPSQSGVVRDLIQQAVAAKPRARP